MKTFSLIVVCYTIVGVLAVPSPKVGKFGPLLSEIWAQEWSQGQDIYISFNGIRDALAEGVEQATLVVSRELKSTLIHKALLLNAEASQAEAKAILKLYSVPEENVKSFWINNKLFVKDADHSVISALAELPSVTEIEKESTFQLKRPIVHGEPEIRPKNTGILAEWNIEKMGAHLVWEQPWGNNGTGVVVGFIDTGVRGTHESIRDQYRNDGKAWRDPYNQYDVPTDVYNHGTHTVGSVLGKFGLGSAPGAQWIACKGYRDDGTATTAAFAECGQFMICPTDANGQNPDCSRTVHVTSNSWGVWPGTTFFEDILDVWNSVNIVSLFSNGNEGPTPCGDMLAPADSAKTMGIGATGARDELAAWSSRGPSRYGVMKPDISAPGINIRSADCRGDYNYVILSGTSMSCPNAAGIATLMVGKNRDLGPTRAKQILQSTAIREVLLTGETCGGVPDSQWPNNHFGHGRIDGFAAVQAV